MTIIIKQSKTLIKTFLLTTVMGLAFACSNNQNNTPSATTTPQTVAANEKSVDPIIVNGTVKTVTFGKDGYSAEVQTAKEGIYAALVSITNVGGRENYKSCEVGDTVTFEGEFSVLENIRQVKVSKIISIIPTSSSAKHDAISKIRAEDYCWQTSKTLNLHKLPSADSKVEGKHFAGEVLKVLGTKVINNQLWVNVKYSLAVKPGYEDQFADGRVTPSGSPTGWIGGTETPEISCK